MEDLEDSDLEEVDFYLDKPSIEKRIQLKRGCQTKFDSLFEKNKELDDSLDTSNDDSIGSENQNYQDDQIKEYYDKYGTNPPWQKDSREEFACPHCNLDCKTNQGLKTHDNFYHQPRPTTSKISDEVNQLQTKISRFNQSSISNENSASSEENCHNKSNDDSRMNEDQE